MKIEKIDIPEERSKDYGLKSVKMDRLNHVVLIAGKNGAGKSRLLTMLKHFFSTYSNYKTAPDLNYRITQLKEQVAIWNSEIAQHKKNFSVASNEQQKKHIEGHINRLTSSISNYKENITSGEMMLKQESFIFFNPGKLDNHLIDFVPKSITLEDSYTMTSEVVDQSSKYIYSRGIQNISKGTIPAIEKIQRSWVNVNTKSIDDLNVSEEEKTKINTDYEKLKRYIRTFLNTDLKRTKEGYPELFGKRIGKAELSDGQKVLLQFCMALYGQEADLENLVIFMDEPENHLHPAALIEVLDKIAQHVKNGQLWIATHSINILAHFDPSSIWYMEDGKISYAGNVPTTVLDGLLGNEDEIEKLATFLSLPAQMASSKFAYESLFYPQVLITNSNDPQVAQIHGIIKEKVESGIKLKVLDFGIGKGRLLSTIHENERLTSRETIDWLDYYGLDIDPTNKAICTQALENIYGNENPRYFNESKELLASQDENTFDFIVMCNVFHEIDPKDWLILFNSATSPFKLLKEEGSLIIIEDQFLAVGEKAHAKGFLVFDSLEFKKLFRMTSVDKYVSTDYRQDGRLKSHHIPKNCINRIDANSRKEAIAVLQQNAKDEIKKLRLKDPSYKIGKLHGFWSQQLANATLSLEEL